MKKLNYQFLLFLCLLCIGVSNAWAEPVTVTYAVKDAKSLTVSGTAPSGSSASFTGGALNSGTMQMTSGKSVALTLTGYNGYKITGITLSVKSNKSSGAGSFTATAGTTTLASIATSNFNSANWNGAWSTSLVSKAVSLSNDSYEIKNGENVVLTMSATANSLYIASWAITYDVVSAGTVTLATPTFDVAAGSYGEPKTIKISNYDSNNSYAYTTDGTDPSFSGSSISNGTAYDNTQGIAINKSCTLKVIARNSAGTTSSIASAAYNLTVYGSLEELVAADLTTNTTVTVTFKNVQIKEFFLYNGYRNGVFFNIQKDGKDIEIYSKNVPAEWVVGGYLSGTITCPWKLYSGIWELQPASTWTWSSLEYKTTIGTLSSIEISGTPTKKNYMAGDAFDPSGLTVTAKYSDNTFEDVTADCSWTYDYGTGNSKLVAGATSCGITATYQDKTAQTTVNGLTVTAKLELIGIEAKATSTKPWKGDDVDNTVITVTALWEDWSEADVTDDCTFTGYDKMKAGPQTVTATYRGATDQCVLDFQTIANTQETAYTVSEIKEIINAGKDLSTSVYVKGTVSAIVSAYSATNGYISFNIAEGDDTFQFYHNRKDAENKYLQDPVIEVGDRVIGFGQPTLYNTTYEYAEGNYLVQHKKSAEKTIVSLAVTGTPTKTCYFAGEALDPTGLIVTATYEDGHSAAISEGFDWELDPVKFTTGTTSCDVLASIGENITSEVYTVTGLTVKALTALSISGEPTQKTYFAGEAFNPAGLTVTGTYTGGSTGVITEGLQWIVDPETLTAGATSCTVMVGVASTVSDEFEVTGLTVYPVFSGFTATSGDIDANVSYAASQGGSSTAPAIVKDSKDISCLRLYQNGGYVTLTGAKGVKIQKVVIKTGSTFASTTIGHSVDDGEDPTTGTEVAKESTYTIQGINNNSVSIFCLGTNKDTRLEIASIAVVYTKQEITLSSISLGGTCKTEFQQYDTFVHDGLTVTANYTKGDPEDVTSKATFSTPDMNAVGTQTVTVSYTWDGTTKSASYDIAIAERTDYFYESFDKNNSTGGNDDKFNVGSGTNTPDNTGWSFSSDGGANKCIKLGTGSAAGSAKTPAIKFAGPAILTFKAAGWDGDINTTLNISVSNGTIGNNPSAAATGSQVSVSMKSAQWTTYSLFIAEVTESTQITFKAGNASKNRFFLDEVKVAKYAFSPISSIAITGTPAKTDYIVDESFDRSGLVLTATLENGNAFELSPEAWTCAPATFTTGGTQTVTVTATYNSTSYEKSVDVQVAKKKSTITIADQELSLEASYTIAATTTPADAALTYTIKEGADYITLEGDKITAKQGGVATVKATYAGNDQYEACDTTFTVTVKNEISWNLTAASYDAASTEEVMWDNPYATMTLQKGTAITDANNYLGGSKTTTKFYSGNTLTFDADASIAISKIELTCYSTSTMDGLTGATWTNATMSSTGKVVTLTANGGNPIQGTLSGQAELTKVRILYIDLSSCSLSSIAVSGSQKTSFYVGDTFDSNGLIVTAQYSTGDTRIVTNKAEISAPDMTNAGDKEVTVSFTEGDITKTATYTISVVEPAVASLALSGTYQTEFNINDTFSHEGLVVTAKYENGAQIAVEAEFSSPDMSTMGEKTVTVSFCGKETTYTIKVNDPMIIFYESFDKTNGTGGNDSKWNGSVGSSTVYYDGSNWKLSNAGGAKQCLKLGTGSAAGSATTPAINYTGFACLSFKAAAWDGDKNTITVYVSNTAKDTIFCESVTLTNAAWTTFNKVIEYQSGYNITFKADQTKNNRFFLDEVSLKHVEGCTLTSSEKLQGWKTFYHAGKDYKVDHNTTIFAAIKAGASAITVRPTGSNIIPAGTPVLLKTADVTNWKINMMEIESTDVVVEDNIFQAAVGGETNTYILAYTNAGGLAFYKYTSALDTGDVYIPVTNGATALRIFIEDEEETGIQEIEWFETESQYDLNGRKAQQSNGLLIKGNKIMLVK